MLFLMILAVVWAAVLVPPFVRSRRDGRPGSSVTSFRAQLSTLERATPGSSLRPVTEQHRPSSVVAGLGSIDARRRRRDVLVGLLGATGLMFVLAFAVGGLFTLLFLVSAAALGAYVYALRQRHLRAMERVSKVRVLAPRTAAPAPVLAVRTAR